MKFNLKEIILIGIFAAITGICAQIAFQSPFSPVAVTLQTFAVFLSAAVLGKKCGAFSQIIYLLIGAIGIPVFSNFHGGIGVILGPSGGYLISFPIIAFIIGFVIERKKNLSIMGLTALMFLGLLICYSIGTAQLAFLMKLSFAKALALGVIPFIPFDILKIILSSAIGFKVRNSLIKANLIFNIGNEL
jgi:biotin transport system substrate-specific component